MYPHLHIQEEEQGGRGGPRLPFSSLGQIQHCMGILGKKKKSVEEA